MIIHKVIYTSAKSIFNTQNIENFYIILELISITDLVNIISLIFTSSEKFRCRFKLSKENLNG